MAEFDNKNISSTNFDLKNFTKGGTITVDVFWRASKFEIKPYAERVFFLEPKEKVYIEINDLEKEYYEPADEI